MKHRIYSPTFLNEALGMSYLLSTLVEGRAIPYTLKFFFLDDRKRKSKLV
jgi:hypothetical protein